MGRGAGQIPKHERRHHQMTNNSVRPLLAASPPSPVALHEESSPARQRNSSREGSDLGGRDQGYMAALVARASPAREFFVNMLTRDIALRDCILDLVDNCIDGAHRLVGDGAISDPHRHTYRGYSCEISLSRGTFQITDNCGGIPLYCCPKLCISIWPGPQGEERSLWGRHLRNRDEESNFQDRTESDRT